jgi:hypothetical protein
MRIATTVVDCDDTGRYQGWNCLIVIPSPPGPERGNSVYWRALPSVIVPSCCSRAQARPSGVRT